MPQCLIDDRKVEFTPGENLIEVAKKVGVEIPFFCYHPALTVVAQCRMCAVEVGMPGKDGTVQMMGKLQTACSTPPAEGMVVKTKTEKVLKNQKSVMEFLLINHPLDCPICDKSGECDLQDNSFRHGDSYMRYTEERRTYLDLDMGPVIKKNMNRCIHCTRCIRFGTEVAGIREMVAVQRGNNTEITTIDGRPLETDYAGNYADICPTGSLTLKNFRFRKRAWFLKKTPSVCEGCSRGCNIELHQDGNVVHRTLPRTNMEINKYWLCDEGRFNSDYVNDADRVVTPSLPGASGLAAVGWEQALGAARASLEGKALSVLVGSDLTQEEASNLKTFLGKQFPKASVFHYGTKGIKTAADDAAADKILKRKSRTSNLHGLEKLGYQGFTGLPAGTEAVLLFRGGRAELPDLSQARHVVGVGVFMKQDAAAFHAVLPGPSWAEKDGTIVNFEGREQKIRRSILPVGQSKNLSEILMLWANQGGKTGVA